MNRAKWKGFYINFKARNSEIIPQFLDLTFKVHNGKSYIEITITDDMIGYKFGEFVFTRSQFRFKKKKSKK